MEMSNIYELWDRFDASTAGEMEIEMNGVRFSLKKGTTSSVIPVNTVETVAPVVNQTATVKTVAGENVKTITAPLVGTFYLAASPDAKPFVSVGDKVNKGDVVCIIEAMKLMNEVKATEDGIVKAILATDASMVEYGQALITLE